ncbi:MAG: SymE family type I addiction module toxin [Verrucomicrobiota bacterium]
MKARNLKIEATGDFWRGQVKPKIRLTGQWLERAGFKAGNRVVVHVSQPGTITLQFVDQTTYCGLNKNQGANTL